MEPIPFFDHAILEEESNGASPSDRYMLAIGHCNVHVRNWFIGYEVGSIRCHIVRGARIYTKELIVIEGFVGDGSCHVAVG
jgi:hypothetical protein